jgi:hypothetical protein
MAILGLPHPPGLQQATVARSRLEEDPAVGDRRRAEGPRSGPHPRAPALTVGVPTDDEVVMSSSRPPPFLAVSIPRPAAPGCVGRRAAVRARPARFAHRVAKAPPCPSSVAAVRDSYWYHSHQPFERLGVSAPVGERQPT